MVTDYYETLDVTVDATREEIKRAYRRRVRLTHPDTGGDADEFRAVQEAWETLGDEQKRATYDHIRIRQTSNPLNAAAGGFPPRAPFATGGGFPQPAAYYGETASARIRAEANRLFEEVLRRQRLQQEREQEIQALGQPLFPLRATQWGQRMARLYVEAMLWGTPYARVARWKRIDIWLIRFFLLAAIAVNIGVLLMAIVTATPAAFVTQVASTVMYTAFLDLVAVFLGFVAGGITWLYRWVHTLRVPRR